MAVQDDLRGERRMPGLAAPMRGSSTSRPRRTSRSVHLQQIGPSGLFQYRSAGVCAFSMALVVTQLAVDRRPHVIDPALTALWPQDRSSGLHGPALPDMGFRNRASSNFSSNFVSESESTGFVEDLIRLQAEAAGDDFLLDLGGAAEDLLRAVDRPVRFSRVHACSPRHPATGRSDRRERWGGRRVVVGSAHWVGIAGKL